jgi:hypothetical protein
VVFVPLAWQLVQLKWNKRQVMSVENPDTVEEEDQYEGFAGLLTSIVTQRRCAAPRPLLQSVSVALPLAARVFGATAFGNAYGFSAVGKVPLAIGVLTMQKCFGTFASSMIVESRLVSKRHNLWGAIGAHYAFNTIGIFLWGWWGLFKPVSLEKLGLLALRGNTKELN